MELIEHGVEARDHDRRRRRLKAPAAPAAKGAVQQHAEDQIFGEMTELADEVVHGEQVRV